MCRREPGAPTPAETLPHAADAPPPLGRLGRRRQRPRQSALDFPTIVGRRTSSPYTGVYTSRDVYQPRRQ